MSTLTVLKEYLIGDGGYLLNDDNNGKTVMLSGAWGSGKTHFWQSDIEPKLSEKLKKDDKKACVYVSLYGKDNIEAIKSEILFKAYESIKNENKLAKRAISAFGFGSRLLSLSAAASGVGARVNTSAVGDAVEGFFESKKIDEAESFLADGGLICLDDFERKSKHIDLNDLFGFIAQLAIDMNCKMVIILNSDVFEGDEANVFKTVKEKTVNKFFHFKPERRELFDSIYDRPDNKYEDLDAHREDIFNAIDETEELNARIYIQILDNCLEWIGKGYDSDILKPLVLSTMNFIFNGLVLDYPFPLLVSNDTLSGSEIDFYKKNMELYPVKILGTFEYSREFSDETFIHKINDYILENEKINGLEEDEIIKWIKDNRKSIMALWKYGYKLYYFDNLDSGKYTEIANFIKTGILSYKEENL